MRTVNRRASAHPTINHETMFSYVIEDYNKLTPKGRLILLILVDDYAENDEDGLTRREIAHRLGQHRLNPHDDKALRQLEDLGYIFVSVERKGDVLARQYDDYSFLRSKRIEMHTRFHIIWLNGAFYPLLDRLVHPRAPRESESMITRLMRWFTG